MAICKRILKSGAVRYQAKIKGTDGRWLTEFFASKNQAEAWEARQKLDKLTGKAVTSLGRQMTVNEYFPVWFEESKSGKVSDGWRMSQAQIFRDYIAPILGRSPLRKITPADINRVLRYVTELGRSRQTQLHVYNVMHKMLGDAVEHFEILETNPVKKRLRPDLIEREAPYLLVTEVRRLLSAIEGKPYEVAICLGVYAGLRVGEIQALRWADVDFERNKIHVRGTFARKEKRFRDYPKGRRWHSVEMPPELALLLKRHKVEQIGERVVTSPRRPFLTYGGYYKALKRYCAGLGITKVGTHGLRHSTSEIYREHGASRDDMRSLFAHSSSRVTDRYIHDKGERLAQVANIVRLFPERAEITALSHGVSHATERKVDGGVIPC